MRLTNAARLHCNLAASKGKNTIIQYLVDKGANLNAKDNKKQTPLSMAMGAAALEDRFEKGSGPRKRTVDLLLKLGAEPVTGPVEAPTPDE